MATVTFHSVNILHIIYATIVIFSIFLVFGKDRYKALGILLLFTAIQMVFNILEELDITRQYYLVTPAIPLALSLIHI